MIYSFAAEVLEKIENETIRSRFRHAVQDHLARIEDTLSPSQKS